VLFKMGAGLLRFGDSPDPSLISDKWCNLQTTNLADLSGSVLSYRLIGGFR
jgi:hypothetical protein